MIDSCIHLWSISMHELLKSRFPDILRKYGYYEAEKKVHLCQYLFEKSNKRKINSTDFVASTTCLPKGSKRRRVVSYDSVTE